MFPNTKIPLGIPTSSEANKLTVEPNHETAVHGSSTSTAEISRKDHPIYRDRGPSPLQQQAARLDWREHNLPATIIRTESGNIFELLNERNFEVPGGKTLLGSGVQCTSVRLARHLPPPLGSSDDTYVAVKKFFNVKNRDLQINAATEEFLNYQRLGDSPFFIKAIDIAHIPDGKSYVFMEFIQGRNGELVINTLAQEQKKLIKEGTSTETVDDYITEKLLNSAEQYVSAVMEMHKRGYCHKDIKLGNFMHDERSGRIVICDYGNMQPYDNEGKIEDTFDLATTLENMYAIAKEKGFNLNRLGRILSAAEDIQFGTPLEQVRATLWPSVPVENMD